jgi:DNA replication protein DnaC
MMQYPVPARHRTVMPADLQALAERNDPVAWKAAMNWLQDWQRWHKFSRAQDKEPGHGLVLSGPVGTGKTTLACAFYNSIERDTKNTAGFITDAQLATLLRYQHRDDEALEQVRLLQNIGCLVLDDLLRMGSQGIPLEIEAFIRVRENNGWPTIITLNTVVQLPETLDSLLTTWTRALFEGTDLRDPHNVGKLRA